MKTVLATYEALPPADYTGKGPKLEVREDQVTGQDYDVAVTQLRAQTPAGFRLVALRTAQRPRATASD